LVDDHELFRKGIASLLGSDWEICGEAANGREAVQRVRELKPDLVLLDLGMPVMGGTATAREIRRIAPDVRILVLSMHESDSVEQFGKLVHVEAYLTKGCSPKKLKETIAALLNPAS
jgi:DNA-binding NarL/FixJ family response regulator